MKQRFFSLAKELSKHSDHKIHKHGAVVVNKSRVISVGFNKLKTTPRSPHTYKQIHAEMAAIFSSRANLDGCSIYIFRETKDGCMAESKPCSACMQVIRAAGIKRIFYSTKDGYKSEVI